MLLGGDAVFFLVALWVTLLVRYLEIPSREIIELHFTPFLLLSAIWVTVYFIAGLYDKQTTFVRRRLLGLIVNAQIFNVGLAAVFFFVIPYFGIEPKTNLLIYLVISSLLIAWWRLSLSRVLSPKRNYRALLFAESVEAEELVHEVNNNTRYQFEFVHMVDSALARSTPDFGAKVSELIARENITVVVADPYSEHLQPFLPSLFASTFLTGNVLFLDLARTYEDIFDRLPLSTLRYEWFFSHISRSTHIGYDVFKRAIDLVGCMFLSLVLAALFPLVALLMRLEGKGPLFISQKRIGQYGREITIYKFRTMQRSENGPWLGETDNKITKVGNLLRITSVDELPQIYNILKGEMSLIGPRNDISSLGKRLAEEIPYYNIRYLIKPGISGWAQTHQAYGPGKISPQSIEESRVRLAYDLYYIKRRSLFLDIAIGLRTLKTLLGRFGVRIQLGYNEVHAQ